MVAFTFTCSEDGGMLERRFVALDGPQTEIENEKGLDKKGHLRSLSSSESIWEFSCFDPISSTRQILCFNGGTCVRSPNCSFSANCPNSECDDCAEGYGADMDWFHFRNCVKSTSSSRNFLIFFTVLTLALVFWYVYFVHRRLRKASRKIGILSFATLWCHFLLVVTVYGQGGCFEGCALTATVDFSLCAIVAQKTLILAVAPVLSLQRRSIAIAARHTKRWTALCCIAFGAGGLAMLSLCRQRATSAYNQAAFFMAASLWACGAANMIIVTLVARRLRVQLAFTEQITRRNYSGIKLRLRFLQWNAIVIFVSYLVSLIAVPAVFVRFHSFPYYHVVFAAHIVLGTVNFTAALLFFVKPGSSLYAYQAAVVEMVVATTSHKNTQHRRLHGITAAPGRDRRRVVHGERGDLVEMMAMVRGDEADAVATTLSAGDVVVMMDNDETAAAEDDPLEEKAALPPLQEANVRTKDTSRKRRTRRVTKDMLSLAPLEQEARSGDDEEKKFNVMTDDDQVVVVLALQPKPNRRFAESVKGSEEQLEEAKGEDM